MTKEELTIILREIVSEVVEKHPLTDEEVQWVRLAIQSEANRAEFRKAVIEKTLLALLGSGFVAVGGVIVNYISNHWKA